MRLKNYNEELVLDTVKLVLKDRKDVKSTHSFALDVAAYALNRIPPKYITSERGFTHAFVGDWVGEETEEKLIDVIELIAIVNRGIDLVAGRRRERTSVRRKVPVEDAISMDRLDLMYFYNIPHIFGRIVDAASGTPVTQADATLFINDQVSVSAEPGWQNPYRTSEQTKGYFTFWPKAESGGSETMKLEMRIGFQHEKYLPLSFRRNLKVAGEFFVYDYIRGDRVLDLGTLALQPK
jgi:competence protein ComFB